jgi:hypothetical protein
MIRCPQWRLPHVISNFDIHWVGGERYKTGSPEENEINPAIKMDRGIREVRVMSPCQTARQMMGMQISPCIGESSQLCYGFVGNATRTIPAKWIRIEVADHDNRHCRMHRAGQKLQCLRNLNVRIGFLFQVSVDNPESVGSSMAMLSVPAPMYKLAVITSMLDLESAFLDPAGAGAIDISKATINRR